jgi:hypothetical protein
MQARTSMRISHLTTPKFRMTHFAATAWPRKLHSIKQIVYRRIEYDHRRIMSTKRHHLCRVTRQMTLVSCTRPSASHHLFKCKIRKIKYGSRVSSRASLSSSLASKQRPLRMMKWRGWAYQLESKAVFKTSIILTAIIRVELNESSK